MLIAIWDWLFTRRQWTILREGPINFIEFDGTQRPIGRLYILQDQFGNIKQKEVKAEQ